MDRRPEGGRVLGRASTSVISHSRDLPVVSVGFRKRRVPPHTPLRPKQVEARRARTAAARCLRVILSAKQLRKSLSRAAKIQFFQLHHFFSGGFATPPREVFTFPGGVRSRPTLAGLFAPSRPPSNATVRAPGTTLDITVRRLDLGRIHGLCDMVRLPVASTKKACLYHCTLDDWMTASTACAAAVPWSRRRRCSSPGSPQVAKWALASGFDSQVVFPSGLVRSHVPMFPWSHWVSQVPLGSLQLSVPMFPVGFPGTIFLVGALKRRKTSSAPMLAC